MPLKDQQKQAKAMELVAQHQASRKPSNLRIKEQASVFDGVLFTVTWHSDTDNRDTESSVFFRGDTPHFFWTPLTLVEFLHQTQPKKAIAALLREFLTIGGGATLIALMITLTICYMAAFRGLEKVPDILGHAFWNILGFYFGSRVTKSEWKKGT
jgi:hypothetical protein